MAYSLIKKHVWEVGVDTHHTKTANRADDNSKDSNMDEVLETGLVWTEVLAEHADVFPSGDHHVADKDNVSIEYTGDFDVSVVAKVLKAALKHFGD